MWARGALRCTERRKKVPATHDFDPCAFRSNEERAVGQRLSQIRVSVELWRGRTEVDQRAFSWEFSVLPSDFRPKKKSIISSMYACRMNASRVRFTECLYHTRTRIYGHLAYLCALNVTSLTCLVSRQLGAFRRVAGWKAVPRDVSCTCSSLKTPIASCSSSSFRSFPVELEPRTLGSIRHLSSLVSAA